MSNVRNLKKDINYVLGDVIEMCYEWEHSNPKKSSENSEKIIEEAISSFDVLIEKVNLGRKAENKKTHYKSIQKELEEKASELIEKVNHL